MPPRIQTPGGSFAARLKNSTSGGPGSTQDRFLDVTLQAVSTSPGSCPAGTRVALDIEVLDPAGDVIVSSSSTGVSCPACGGGNKVRIPVTYTADHCHSMPPLQFGTVDITVSVNGVPEETGRIIECKP